MQLRHIKTLHDPVELVDGRFQKVCAMSWSPNNYRIAAATTDRYIILYDEDGNLKEKFPTKPSDKAGPKTYAIRGLSFSPDSQKLAVAQSDNIVFIYKLGSTWADKKTICNKFVQSSQVTTQCWPSQRPNELVYGLADGKVRFGNLKTNKSGTLYNTDSYVVSCCPSPDGASIITGHLDGSIFRYNFPASGADTDATGGARAAAPQLLATVPFAPYALAWGASVLAAGNSPIVKFLDPNKGTLIQQFDYSSDERVKEFSTAAFNPSGQTVVVGNYSSFFTYAYSPNKNLWDEGACTRIDNLLSITSMLWKVDGSKMVLGSLCGCIDMFDACLRRVLYKNEFEFTYTSSSSLIVKRLNNGQRVSVRSRFGADISKVNIYSSRYLVAHTPSTLLLGDLDRVAVSEVEWTYSVHGKEKFYFDNEGAALVFNAGELSVVEYGENTVLGSCRTEYMSPHQLSLSIHSTPSATVKKLAYLLDSHTIRVIDLLGGTSGSSTKALGSVNVQHDLKIDWLEMNQRGNKLLFRDKRRALHLFDVVTQTRSTLLPFCNYVQWVPDSDVVVAQSRRTLHVWYSIDNPSDVTTINIKGDVEQIERGNGKTEVKVDEGVHTAIYQLDEALIAFGFSVESHDLHKAVSILEGLALSPGVEAMWTRLSKLALDEGNFVVAERCFSALGDVSKSKFLHRINDLVVAQGGDVNHYMVRAQIAILNKQFRAAEAILLSQGAVEEAIAMYRQLHKWEEAIAIAESKNMQNVKALKNEYFAYLLQTKQEEVAGALKEKEGEASEALQLYLKGGFPAKAADLILSNDFTSDTALCEKVATALLAHRNFEKAGQFFESLKWHKRALEAYEKGHAYFRAVELCRREFPAQVVRLEEDWGDYLVSSKQMDAACTHYMQSGSYLKAINAAVEARQWSKAVAILDQIEPATAKLFYKRIANHFAETKKYSEAEKYYIQGGLPQEAVSMYTAAGLWDKAHSIAVTYMPEQEVTRLYTTQAQKQEVQGKFKDAERLYLTVNEPDLAITMYKKNRQYDDMIRLVSQYRRDSLPDVHTELAQRFEHEGNFKTAENHYLKSGPKGWSSAVNMYKEVSMWEDVLRIAKQYGGQQAYKQWAYAFAVSVGGDAGVKLLAKRGLGELAVDYAVERGEFTEAFTIAEKTCKQKLPEVHLQYAMALEDDGKFARAEEQFIKAKKPKEAIDMYIHQQEWDSATRVAEQFDPQALSDVYEARAKQLEKDKNYHDAESFFVQARKPQLAVAMFQAAAMWDDALRVAKTHVPSLTKDINNARMNHIAASVPQDSGDYLINQAKMLVTSKNYSAAIDAYLKVTRQHTQDLDSLERVWENAVTLAMEYVPPRANEVVHEIARRLLDIGRQDSAADLYISIEAFKEAIDIYIGMKNWDKAKNIAAQDAPHLRDYVAKTYQSHLVSTNQLSTLSNENPDAALEIAYERRDWNEVYALAAKQGEEIVQRYAAMQASELVSSKKYKAALSVFVKHGASVAPANFPLYKHISTEVLSSSEYENSKTSSALSSSSKDAMTVNETYFELREMLYKLVSELSVIDRDSANTAELQKLLLIAHFASLRGTVAGLDGLRTIGAKLSISLCRYTKEMPVDKIFFDAGAACKEEGWVNMTFVLWNRFVDLSDKIAEPDSGDIDNSDFIQTDIPSPATVPFPPRAFYSADVLEEARSWVLEAAMNNDVGQSLSTRTCERCSKQTYEANLTCHSCKLVHEPCIVTGYPVLKATRLECSSCHKPANRDDWNKYVTKTKTCPWCGNLQNPNY